MSQEPFSFKKLFLGKLSRRLTLLFLLVGIVAPALGIYYFYSISFSLISQNPEFAQQNALLETTTIVIIVLIAIDAGIIGFFVSRSIAKPIHELHKATEELEKGNFNVVTNIKTHDEIEQLSHAFNQSAVALGRMAEERQRLERAKSEFLSITSHELRTPMTPLKAQLQLLQHEYLGPLTNKQRESVDIILRNAERLNKIIEDFLEISRIEAARLRFVFRKTNLQDTIQETVRFMEGFAKDKNITLIVHSDDLPVIDIDPDRVSQVLRNLIHNAIKFSKNDSSIKIAAIGQKEYILFSVKDQGAGMNSVDQIRVFEPFYQVEGTLSRKYGGTGLGLTICRGIVEAQKGKIWVDSEPGKGSTFYFTVPLIPIHDMEPIKVLFSPKAEIERKVKEAFTIALGPMGVVEFNELKNKNALVKKDLFAYIESLKNENILSSKHAELFKNDVGVIFGEEISKEKIIHEINR